MKIGLIAGGGALPLSVEHGAREDDHDLFVCALSGFADAGDFSAKTATFGLAEFGKITAAFKDYGCTHVCFTGTVSRPDFKALRPDMKALRHLPGAIVAAKSGDDALLSYILSVFEQEGFTIIAPQDLCKSLLIPCGVFGAASKAELHRSDIEKACETALAIGALDIGQGAVVCRGLVLAVEAQEGTDAMLRRVAALPDDLRGRAEKREGVLAKMVKPGQEVRVDLPTIGLETVRLAAAAGLAGIVAEEGQAFIIDKAAVIDAATEAGLFIAGLPAATP